MRIIDRKIEIDYRPIVLGNNKDKVSLVLKEEKDSKSIYLLKVPTEASNQVLTIQFKLKAIGVKGSWSPDAVLDKRFRPDWETVQLNSSVSVNAPILCLFGHDDNNVLSLSCSDAINPIQIEAALREEDNHFYCSVKFFTTGPLDRPYETCIAIDKTKANFGHVIQQNINWLINEFSFENKPTPELAKVPLYSTWYSFHQNLEEKNLLTECQIAKELGYELIIIDDGWQTMDDNRGYDYAGDWNPDRFKNIGTFVYQVHTLGMGIMFWFSVPYAGKKSNAYQKFKGKFLTEEHPWAPILDPRFPDVRLHLVELYKRALIDWKIDGFKLDFIDDFKIYQETEMDSLNGRDTISVAEGTFRLITEISHGLQSIKPDVLIEFRQKYISPALHQLGNMFRAFDCPNDPLVNKVRTTDVKLICGKKAPHSDMITWNKDEPVEIAALQFSHVLFSVPQLSIRLAERTPQEIEMIRFYTNYWNQHKHIILDGQFTAFKPLANYPYLSASKDGKIILGLYDDVVLPISLNHHIIHIVNGKLTNSVILSIQGKASSWHKRIVDCTGKEKLSGQVELANGIQEISCPPSGMIFLTKNINQ